MDFSFDVDHFIRHYVTRREQSLLTEDFVRYNTELHDRIDGKRVFVIGGAGSIGSHYIKALLRFNVASLYVADISENGLTELVRDLRSSGIYTIPRDFITYPVSFGDRVFEKIFKTYGPFDIVANFAAHKHVRSEKDIFSIEAMIENNLFRARDLLNLLCEAPPQRFFCVSTDKAANPVNIMGASKKLMEELIMAYANKLPVTTARFANVAFSNGSLPYGFLERLNKRQPWSCPLGIRRFFVSPMESGELCLIASIMSNSGDIVFPKLDEYHDMIPFDQIVRDLLTVLGMTPNPCVSEAEAREKCLCSSSPTTWPVYFFEPDTSGEKPFEEFFVPGETLDLDTFVNLGIIKNTKPRSLEEIDEMFTALRAVFAKPYGSKAELVDILKDYLPNFSHIETNKSLDQKM